MDDAVGDLRGEEDLWVAVQDSDHVLWTGTRSVTANTQGAVLLLSFVLIILLSALYTVRP